jgi:hypothetical protein
VRSIKGDVKKKTLHRWQEWWFYSTSSPLSLRRDFAFAYGPGKLGDPMHGFVGSIRLLAPASSTVVDGNHGSI